MNIKFTLNIYGLNQNEENSRAQVIHLLKQAADKIFDGDGYFPKDQNDCKSLPVMLRDKHGDTLGVAEFEVR